jgi:hypothetical protein
VPTGWTGRNTAYVKGSMEWGPWLPHSTCRRRGRRRRCGIRASGPIARRSRNYVFAANACRTADTPGRGHVFPLVTTAMTRMTAKCASNRTRSRHCPAETHDLGHWSARPSTDSRQVTWRSGCDGEEAGYATALSGGQRHWGQRRSDHARTPTGTRSRSHADHRDTDGPSCRAVRFRCDTGPDEHETPRGK